MVDETEREEVGGVRNFAADSIKKTPTQIVSGRSYQSHAHAGRFLVNSITNHFYVALTLSAVIGKVKTLFSASGVDQRRRRSIAKSAMPGVETNIPSAHVDTHMSDFGVLFDQSPSVLYDPHRT